MKNISCWELCKFPTWD